MHRLLLDVSSSEEVPSQAESHLRRRELMYNTSMHAELQKALEDIFDQALLYHGYTDYMRDYELFIRQPADPRTQIAPRTLRYRFKDCVQVDVRTTVQPDVWRVSLDDRLTDFDGARDMDGYIWGVRWQELYPGGRIVEGSELARAWGDSIGIPFFEIVIEANAHSITLVASDLEVTEADPDPRPSSFENEVQ